MELIKKLSELSPLLQYNGLFVKLCVRLNIMSCVRVRCYVWACAWACVVGKCVFVCACVCLSNQQLNTLLSLHLLRA